MDGFDASVVPPTDEPKMANVPPRGASPIRRNDRHLGRAAAFAARLGKRGARSETAS
jgi:hypothetical protein